MQYREWNRIHVHIILPYLYRARRATLKVGGVGGLTSDSKWGG